MNEDFCLYHIYIFDEKYVFVQFGILEISLNIVQ